MPEHWRRTLKLEKRLLERAAVSRRAEESIINGHPWVYESDVTDGCAARDGDVVEIVNQKGRYLATGFINRSSKIRLRVLTRNRNDDPDGRAFWERRLRSAVDYRRTVMGNAFDCCRLIFGESDGMPGLTVDRFGDVLVAQTLCLGMDKRKGLVLPALADILREQGCAIRGIYERNDVSVRSLEGMEQGKGWYSCTGDRSCEVIICENGIKYYVDIENGQKTGFFLDQKFNRAAVAAIARQRRVLDCFTHTGSFALNCAAAGAESVTAVDISEAAVAQAKRNAELNGLADKMSCIAANVFDLLPTLKKGEYDLIILDPPAFTKSRSTIGSAERGYKEINLRALKALGSGGFLATCSCSHFMEDGNFREMIRAAAADAGAVIRLVEARQQAMDHPVLWNVPETSYLKFYIFQKM